MRLYVPATLRPHLLGHGSVVDTETMSQMQITELYGKLSDLSERITEIAAPDDRPDLQEEITSLTATLIDAINVPDVAFEPRVVPSVVVPMVSAPTITLAPTVLAAVINPHLNRVRNLRGNFGNEEHDRMHFAPTETKTHHGVWGKAKLEQVRAWVRMAVDSIWAGDRYLVASKAGNKTGARTYLVNMDQVVGYLSGSAQAGRRPQATHVEVYIDAKGNTVSAFPSDPSVF